MKYWEAINVPNPNPVVEVVTDDVSDNINEENIEEVAVVDVESATTEPEAHVEDCSDILNKDYTNLYNQAFNIPNTSEDTIDVDEVPETESEFECAEVDDASAIDIDIPDENNKPVSTPVVNGDDILNSIIGENNDIDIMNNRTKVMKEISERISSDVLDAIKDKITNKSFTLGEEEFGNLVSKMVQYQKDYFSELPIEIITRGFVRNVPKEMYRAHLDVAEKYSMPPILDPAFLLYPFSMTEEPVLGMAKFWSIVLRILKDPDNDWIDEIDKYIAEYDDFVYGAVVEEDSESETESPDIPPDDGEVSE